MINQTRTDMSESQLSRIKAHLLAGKTITPLEALNLFGCLRLAPRISNLRNAGLPIITEMVQYGRKRYARYSLKK